MFWRGKIFLNVGGLIHMHMYIIAYVLYRKVFPLLMTCVLNLVNSPSV